MGHFFWQEEPRRARKQYNVCPHCGQTIWPGELYIRKASREHGRSGGFTRTQEHEECPVPETEQVAAVQFLAQAVETVDVVVLERNGGTKTVQETRVVTIVITEMEEDDGIYDDGYPDDEDDIPF